MKAIQKIKSNLSKITNVLRHGILSLYSYIRKFISWRSRTSTNSLSSSSSFNSSALSSSSISSYIRSLRNVRIVGMSSSIMFGLLALAIIIPLYNVSGTEDTEAATGTATDSSITFTSTRTTATVDLTPTSTSGTFASSTSGTTDAAFSITTTNSQGYELKIKSTSGTVLKPNTTTSDSDGLSTISTSGITSSSFTNNTWGYLPNYYNCNEANGACNTNTTNYYPATTSDVTLRKTTSANTTAHNYTIGLGAKADLTKTSGTYTLGGNSNSMVLSYVANPTTYSIAYDRGKATSNPSNMPSTQSGSVSATSVTLRSNTPTLTGYTFTGWCLGEVSRSSAEVDSCTGTGAKTFAAGASFGIDRTSTNSVTLHAMWTKASVNVTVNFAGSGVTGVTFTNGTYGNVSVSTSGGTAVLKYGVSYTITGTYSSGYEFSSWSATDGTLGSASSASTTYSTTSAATLTLTGKSSGYTITFKANGGTGSDYAQTIAQGSADNLFGNSFTRSGYYFKGWGTDTSAVAYRPGQSITPSGDMTLYAIWGSSTSTSLYNIVASLNNGRTLDNTSTNGTGLSAKAGIQATITKDNSGVFSYNSSTFGTASDASTSNTIYLYRGILDNVEGTYGSDGDGGNYPNYVKLGNNTCWRILRTTGSGGVKLIYNGTYGATTSGSCANATTKAQVITSAFNSSSASNGYTSVNYKNIHAVGYTYNNSVTSSTSATAASTVFGSNSNYSVNSSPSIMKQYLEQTWYRTNMEAYTSKLESSAGYCNDRSLYASGSYTSALSESTTIVPYGTSGLTQYSFGSKTRNSSTAQKPSLTCPRNVVDLYTTSSASNGNKQLGYPVALATADEMSFAGSGNSTASNGSSYNAKSFAWPGSYFWLLSPSYRFSDGNAYGYYLFSSGTLDYNGFVVSTFGVRPVISLKLGTTPASGSGTATDPWVVTPPPPTIADATYMQDVTSAMVNGTEEGATATLTDSRDNQQYTVKKINGQLWMTRNLAIGCNGSGSSYGSSVSSKSLTRSNSNVSSTWSTPTARLSTSENSYATSGYTTAAMQCSSTYGAWYNYAAATAGTITGNPNTTAATKDICPAGWHLPTGPNTTSGTDFAKLMNSTSSSWLAINGFPGVAGGYYSRGSLIRTLTGEWWSATADNAANRYSLVYNSNDSHFIGSNAYSYNGLYVRCVRTS